jgi:hypothetical protein
MQTQEFFVLIEQKWKNHQPASYRNVSIWLHEKWYIDLAPNTLLHFVQRISMLHSAKEKSMEIERLNVPDDAVHDWFTMLQNSISDTPANFVYNMDYMGHRKHAGAKPIELLVPAYVADMPYYDVSRRAKRILIPLTVLILSRQIYDDELVEYVFTPEKTEIYPQNHAPIDSDIFFDWLKNTFVPDGQRRRVAFDYWGPAFLLLDNCSPHCPPQKCRIHPHPSHSFHVLTSACLVSHSDGFGRSIARKK